MAVLAYLGFIVLFVLAIAGALFFGSLAGAKVHDPLNNVTPFNAFVMCVLCLGGAFVGVPAAWVSYNNTESAADVAYSKSINDQGFALVKGGRNYSSIEVQTKSGCQIGVLDPQWDGKTVVMRVANPQTGATFVLNVENAEKLCTG